MHVILLGTRTMTIYPYIHPYSIDHNNFDVFICLKVYQVKGMIIQNKNFFILMLSVRMIRYVICYTFLNQTTNFTS